MSELHGKRVLVAGGTGNVGRHLVRAQLEAGATVLVPTRSREKLEALLGMLEEPGRDRVVGLQGDITDGAEAAAMLERAGPVDGAVASMGGFVAAPSILEASEADVRRALDGYLLAHVAVARTLVPHLRERSGGYVVVNGPLAFDPSFSGAGLVSIATAAQAMLARVLMRENAEEAVRINELVIYSSFGWGNDEKNAVTGMDIGRYAAYLLSDPGAGVRGETIHLRSVEVARAIAG
jgi:NAD(P)-dependent dehydrogenase (short-subunit alcohol dehydrogenase family)